MDPIQQEVVMMKCAAATFCLVHALVLFAPRAAAADPVSDWNATAGRAALAACISPILDPLHESRMYAMTHIAIHDALNAIDRRSRPYAYRARVEPWVSVDAAVASAARHVLVSVLAQIGFPFGPECGLAGIAVVEADYASAVAAVPPGPARTRGIEVGRAAAEAILALRNGDGSDQPLLDFAHPQGTGPGEWRFTPGFPFALAPRWGSVTPFVRDSLRERVRRPFRLDSRKYLADFDEVKALGGDGVTTPSARTPEQTEIALFWIESSPLQWNRIARTVSAAHGLDQWENARLFGLLNIAMADGYVASFAAKYTFNFWRPVTAIREADDDGHPATVADPSWTPLAPTPPIPDHDSGHSVEGGAASQVLIRFFRRDEVVFAACSLTLPPGATCADAAPRLRSFGSFTQAAEENGLSRILVGFHFRRAVEEGIDHGRGIGNRVVDRVMRETGRR